MSDPTTDLTIAKYSRPFWVDLGDRAVSTAAQTLVATLSAGGLGLLEVDAQAVLSIAALATLLSVLKAFGVRAAIPGSTAKHAE